MLLLTPLDLWIDEVLADVVVVGGSFRFLQTGGTTELSMIAELLVSDIEETRRSSSRRAHTGLLLGSCRG